MMMMMMMKIIVIPVYYFIIFITTYLLILRYYLLFLPYLPLGLRCTIDFTIRSQLRSPSHLICCVGWGQGEKWDGWGIIIGEVPSYSYSASSGTYYSTAASVCYLEGKPYPLFFASTTSYQLASMTMHSRSY